MIKNVTHNFELNKIYLVKSNNELISDYIIDNNNFELEEVIIINALSNNLKTILLPKYRNNNKKELKRKGLHPKIEVGSSEFLQFLIDKMIDDFQILIFGLNGLHFEAVSFLEEYMMSIAKEKNKICILIDYSSEYSNTTIDLIGKDGNVSN